MYEKRYNESQWVISESQNSIGDDFLYAYAGAKYVLGTDPILINSETPPLGKNLIGLSAIYLGNEYLFSMFSGLFALITFYLLCKQVIKDKLVSILLTLLAGLEPLFVVNYFATLLDLLLFGFLNLFFLFLIKYRENNKFIFIYVSGIMLGLIMSIKFFALVLPAFASAVLYLVFKKDLKGLIHFTLSTILSFFILTINYFQFFSRGRNLMDFLKLQKYIYIFHTEGRKATIRLNDSFLKLMFTGHFYSDPDLKKLSPENHFSFLWPIFFLIGIIKSIIDTSSPLFIWIIIYSLSQFFGFTNARYLILLLPYLYLATIDIILKCQFGKKQFS